MSGLTAGQAAHSIRPDARREQLLATYRATRSQSLVLCEPLATEDYRIQSMPDVSPPWWNLGHTSWFFAKNILEPRGLGSDSDSRLEFVLNSYYETHGERLARAERGTVSRPTNDQIFAFRQSVDERVEALIETAAPSELEEIGFLITTGIQHEQQHQELLLTEIKHIFSLHPKALREPYSAASPAVSSPKLAATSHSPSPIRSGSWVEVPSGLCVFGAESGDWCWDNELPRHRSFLEPFELFSRLVTNREYLEFIDDGGYDNALLWLSNGWSAVQEFGWRAPLYWSYVDGLWSHWTLSGDRIVEPDEPVCHVSFHEAYAFAQWKAASAAAFDGCRLPTEFELERAAQSFGFEQSASNFIESRAFHPRPSSDSPTADQPTVDQLAGDLWEWTTSHYEPYPGYRPFEGDLMEYNGKFMDNQRVLRGGSCATPASHMRPSYRNFWPADTRFQFTGVRLARSL